MGWDDEIKKRNEKISIANLRREMEKSQTHQDEKLSMHALLLIETALKLIMKGSKIMGK